MRPGGALIGLAFAAGILLSGAASGAHAAGGDPASWTRPVKPFRIVGDIYYVGSEGLAAYLVGRRHEAVLLDGTLDAKIAQDFEKTFAKLGAVKADVVLTSHPEIADVPGREARAAAGRPDAFVDPTELPRIVQNAHRDFEDELAKARARHPPP